jgi:hypothetical protein
MNERIRDLALRSDFGYIVEDRTGNYRGGLSEDDAERLTKFAQLIAEDCAAYADEMWPHQKEFKGTLNIGQGIRRKFEVPE